MTFFYILIIFGVIFFIFYQKRKREGELKEQTEGKIISQETISKSDIGGVATISVVKKTIDVTPIKKADAEKVIKAFKKPYSIEQEIIMANPLGFIYYVNSYNSRISTIRYDKAHNRPRDYKLEIHYVLLQDSDEYFTEKKFWDWAIKFKLADRGYQIPTEEILKSLQLRKGLNLISDKQFTRISPALEHLLSLPDIDKRLDEFSPRRNYYKLKVVDLDMDYFYKQWDIIRDTN